MRIAILHHAFDPRLSYQECVFARTLTAMGHEVVVFTTARETICGPETWEAVDARQPYAIYRSKRFVQWKKTLFTFDPIMVGHIRRFAPEVAFVMGAGYGPPYYWMRALPGSCRVFSQFSDLPRHRSGGLVWRWKQRWYRKVFARSSLVLAVTEDTAELLRGVGGDLLAGKLRMTGLSFDEAEFRPGAVERCPPEAAVWARRHPFLVAVVTRVTPEKGLEELFAGVEAYLQRNPDAGLVMAGFSKSAYSERLRERIEGSVVGDRCLLLPVLGSSEINGVFAVAGCSVWSQVSIGLQHSLASGCPVILRQGWPAQHILLPGVSGLVYRDFEHLKDVLEEARETEWDKEQVYGAVATYRSDLLLGRLLSELSEPSEGGNQEAGAGPSVRPRPFHP